MAGGRKQASGKEKEAGHKDRLLFFLPELLLPCKSIVGVATGFWNHMEQFWVLPHLGSQTPVLKSQDPCFAFLCYHLWGPGLHLSSSSLPTSEEHRS